MKKGIVLSIVASTVVMAAGYKIPEQSVDSTALSAAYIAHTMGADTAYFNPAAMSFMDDKQYLEGGLTLAHLPSIEYTGAVAAMNGESKVENIIIPYFHYVGKPLSDNLRWGVSLTAPGGLSKRWDTTYQKASAEEFTLRIVELNPSLSYKLSDNFSLGGGVRLIYSDGVVKSTAAVSRDMEGDALEFGYNLAMLYKPTNDINLAVTYRSKVDIKEDGTAKLFSGTRQVYNGGTSVEVPLPATLTIGASKTWNDKLTVEFDWERAYWSAYKELDFEYDSAIPAPLVPYFDAPAPKNWKNSDTYRLGVTYKMDDALTLMGGYAKGESPVPNKTIGFELPDSDANYFSGGFKYRVNDKLSLGAAILYVDKKELNIPAGVASNQVIRAGGSFDKGGALLTTVGVSYEF